MNKDDKPVHDRECMKCENLFKCSGHPASIKEGGCVMYIERKEVKK